MVMSYASKIEDLIAERDELRRQVHNLNWALSMPGFEQMATPEDQAEHEAGAAAVDAVLARMEHNKEQHDAMVKDAERYRFLRGDFSLMVLNIDGNHAWGYRRNATLKGPTMDAAIDAAMLAR
jgi:hypothetical protein